MKNLFCVKEHSCRSVVLRRHAACVGHKELAYQLLVSANEPREFFATISEESGVWLTKSLGSDLSIAHGIYTACKARGFRLPFWRAGRGAARGSAKKGKDRVKAYRCAVAVFCQVTATTRKRRKLHEAQRTGASMLAPVLL